MKPAHLKLASILWLAGLHVAFAGDLSVPVRLETRWWNEHEFGWRLSESAGLRWAIVDGISGRGRAGGENVAAAELAEQFHDQTGIKAEVIGGIVVLHRSDETRRQQLADRLAAGGHEAVRAAWLLGWLKDARAWPILAKAVAGKDTVMALAAAQALRRLDGEEHFDLRRWILYGRTIHGTTPPQDGLWQVPLAAAFPDSLPEPDLRRLAKAPWVPLREAAARLAAGCGASGRTVAETLASDPNPIVRQAAQRSLRAWQAPAEGFRPVPRPAAEMDLAAHREFFKNRGDEGARKSGPWLATFGSDDDVSMLVGTHSTTESVHVRNSTRYVLAANAGGDVAVKFFRQLADDGAAEGRDAGSVSHGKYGLAMLMDGEKLATELGPLLGADNWSLSSEFLLARFAGPPALPYLEKDMARRGYVANLAVGFIGGPDAVKLLAVQLESEDLGAALAAARGLGDTGLVSAVAPLVQALSSPNRVLRSRAALGLGRIGGPEAARALAEAVKTEREYLPRRSACSMLQEIASGEDSYATLAARVEKELDEFVPSYNPVNQQLGFDFPVGRMVSLGRLFTVASVGESRHDVDAWCGILLRYGGCTPYYNNECIGYDPASGSWFVIRPPENLGLFYNEPRVHQGCSPALVFDPRSRKFWIGHAVYGSGSPANDWMYPATTACSYDIALDRFEGNFPKGKAGRQGSTQFVADSIRGRIVPEEMGPVTTMLDTATQQLVDVEFRSALPAADLRYSVKWMHYDALNREVIHLSPLGAHRYDRKQDTWEKTADEDCSVYITLGFDPQHNVFLGWQGGQLKAFRHKNVAEGTPAFYGETKYSTSKNPTPSFPRRRESSLSFAFPLDARLRGHDAPSRTWKY